MFFGIYFAFSESELNFQCFEKNNELHRSSISEVIDYERYVGLNA